MSLAIRQLDSLFRAGSSASLSDAELLARVTATDRGVASDAFEALIGRHGPMVLAACRGVLRDEHDAEDAFQATFLVLLRHAGSLRTWESLGPWLHRVAVRASERARAHAVRQREREARHVELASMDQQPPGSFAEREELVQRIHREVNRLPERFRVVLVICDLQCKSYQQAAAQLHVPVGTIRSRLSRARERLRAGILRRGIAFPAGVAATTLAAGEVSAAVPARLIAETMSLADLAVAGGLAVGSASSAAVAYANELLGSSGLIALGKVGVAVIMLGVGIVVAVSGPGWLPSTSVRQAPPVGSSAAPAIRRGNQGPVGPSDKEKSDPDRSRAALLSLLDEARQSASALIDPRSRARMFQAIATAQAKAGDQPAARAIFQQAVQAADAIKDVSSRIYTLEDIAVAQMDSNDRDAGLATIRRAFEVTETIGNEYARNMARMWIVRTFARGGDLETALRIVRELPESNMIRAIGMGNALEGLKHSGGPGVKQFLPTIMTMAEASGDRTRWSDCMHRIAEVLSDAGEIDALLKIANDLEMAVAESGLQSHKGHYILNAQILVLSSLAKAQAKAGKREAAIVTFDKAAALASIKPSEGESLRSDRLGRLARDRVEAGDIEGALRTCELIVDEQPKVLALVVVAEAQAKAGHRDEARSLFSKAIQFAQEIKIRGNLRDPAGNSEPKPSGRLRTIAQFQARAGFTAEALQTAELIGEPKSKNSALAMIAAAMARRREIKQAVQLVDRIDDEKSKADALQGIAEGQAESGDIEGAVKWAKSRATAEARANALLGVVRAIAKH